MYKVFEANCRNFSVNPTDFGWDYIIVGKMTTRESHSVQGKCRTARGNFCKVHLFEYECIGLSYTGSLQHIHLARHQLEIETENENYHFIGVYDSVEDALRLAKFLFKKNKEEDEKKNKKKSTNGDKS